MSVYVSNPQNAEERKVLLDAAAKVDLLRSMPANGTRLRRLRRWNVAHDYIATKAFWFLASAVVVGSVSMSW